MDKHLIIGAGPVGQATATRLAALGFDVTIASRSGTSPTDPAVKAISIDATDAAAIAAVSGGCAAIYNCVNPKYHRWTKDWPPIATAFLQAAETSGAVLVTMSNLYGYGSTDAPIRVGDPLDATTVKGAVRATMWREALSAHDAGRVRVTEARASDFIGPTAGASAHMGSRTMDRALAGKTVAVVGDPDAPHSWTAIDDVATTLAVLGTDERAWGRAWHVPTDAPLSARRLVQTLCDVADVEAPRVRAYSRFELGLGGVVSKQIKAMHEMLYQFEKPFVIDATETTATFGLVPTPTRDVLADVAGFAKVG